MTPSSTLRKRNIAQKSSKSFIADSDAMPPWTFRNKRCGGQVLQDLKSLHPSPHSPAGPSAVPQEPRFIHAVGLTSPTAAVLPGWLAANSSNRTWAARAILVQHPHTIVTGSLRSCFTEMLTDLISANAWSLGTSASHPRAACHDRDTARTDGKDRAWLPRHTWAFCCQDPR